MFDVVNTQMKYLCEICHKEVATGTKWLWSEEAPNRVGGRYRVGPNCGGPKKQKGNFYGGETT
jgi:hypothetical protein